MDTCEQLAAEYPDVIFSHATGYKSNGTNFNNYFGRIYQARYLAGIAAGMKTTTNKLGYVSAMGQENSECTGGINAFAMGAYSVNPDCEVYVKVTNSWYDPEGETQAAQALIDAGCDVIAQHCDTPKTHSLQLNRQAYLVLATTQICPKMHQRQLSHLLCGTGQHTIHRLLNQ